MRRNRNGSYAAPVLLIAGTVIIWLCVMSMAWGIVKNAGTVPSELLEIIGN